MPNGVRNSIWAVFFLAGMAFMATLIFMMRLDLFSSASVRRKPGSSIVLGGSATGSNEPAPSLVLENEPSPDPTVETEQPRTISKSYSSPQVISANPQSAQTNNTSVESRPEQRHSSTPTATIASTSETPVEIVRWVRPGRNVFGHITLLGELPPPKALPVADRFCGPHSSATSFVSRVFIRAKDNSLADVVVFLRGHDLENRHWIAPPQQPVITQRGCQFEPYITVIQLGQGVAFENLDPILHNVHIRPRESRNRELNVAQTAKGRPVLAQFKETEMFIRTECNIHPYMVSYLCIVPNPFFALTKEDGRFDIPNVPPGEYTIVASHRKAGVIEQKIIVKEDESPDIEFTFPHPVETLSFKD